MVQLHIVHHGDRIVVFFGLKEVQSQPLCFLQANSGVAAAFIQKYKITCTEPRYKTVPVFPLLGHIGDASVHWHEEIFSSGGILLSEENARRYQC